MTNITLNGPELFPASGKPARHLVILLHGYGSDGNDLIGLAPMFAEHLPDAHFISPNAPARCEMSPMGYQWFSLRDLSPETRLRGSQQAAPILSAFIDEQLERFDLTEDKLALVGFSQGTMMALYVSLRRPAACAAVVGFSGALVGEDGWTSKPPICLIHGDEDAVVPYAALGHAEALLKKQNVPVEIHTCEGLGHGIDPDGIDIAISFLTEKLI